MPAMKRSCHPSQGPFVLNITNGPCLAMLTWDLQDAELTTAYTRALWPGAHTRRGLGCEGPTAAEPPVPRAPCVPPRACLASLDP